MAAIERSEGAAAAPPDPAVQIGLLEQQLERLTAALSERVAGAQEETLEHLVVFEEAVHDLEASRTAGP